MLYRAIIDMYGTINSAVAVPDDTDLTAESAMYAANGQYVFPVTEAQYPLVQAAVEDDPYFAAVAVPEITPVVRFIVNPAGKAGAME